MKFGFCLIFSVFSLAFLQPAIADSPRYVGENEVPRPIDVARALAGASFKPHLAKRGLSVEADAVAPADIGSASDSQAVAATDAPAGALDVAIGFALNSADLRPQASTQLDAIAEGLKLLDAGKVIVIDGHTDASGPAAYNVLLSQRRAEAVKQYLVHHHNIAAARLQTHGVGKDEPLDPAHPADPRNRRVQFRLS
ncbi:MAG: OmpA family protein [Dokdonella sp.]